MLTAFPSKDLEVSAPLSSPSSAVIACEKQLRNHMKPVRNMSTLTCSFFGTKHSSCESLRRLLRYGNFSTKLDLCGHSRALMIIALKVSDGMDPCLSCTTT